MPDDQAIKMVPVDADSFEAVGYTSATRRLYIKFRNTPPLLFKNVPGFRFEGLLAAPRKDAYFKTFIRDIYISQTAELPPQIQY